MIGTGDAFLLLLMSRDRIWSDKAVEGEHSKIEKVDERIQAMQAFQTDMKPENKEIELTRMQRKMKRLFGSGKATSNLFVTGFQMGFMVGGAFGSILGTWQAIQMRSFMLIPLSAIGSGVSFGFFMGLGMTFRAGEM
jgi:hypothetical protein